MDEWRRRRDWIWVLIWVLSVSMVDGESRFRRRINEIRDRMNAQFNRLLNEDPPEEEQTTLLDR